MKNNKFMMIVSILLILVMLIGTTFSYFTVSTQSKDNAIRMEAAVIDSTVKITALYNDKPLIPMNDSDVEIAYNDTNKCVDIHGYGACQAYNIELLNNGNKVSYLGSIKFDTDKIENLKYLLLDEEGNEVEGKTLVVSGTDQELGDMFTINSGEAKRFRLIIWLSNIDENQGDTDAAGSFSADVTYVSTFGNKITGTFSVH